jgi:addiction module RelE/StbE family toxin
MWTILETSSTRKEMRRCPHEILLKYEVWKSIVRMSGPAALRALPGLHDEALQGRWQGLRSSRLGLKWRVIYEVEDAIVTVTVVRVTPHDYRR